MHKYLIQKLEHQYSYLISLISELDDNFLKQHFQPGKWSIYEHIAHLGRYHEIFESRINKIIAEGETKFSRYKAEEDKEFIKWCKTAFTDIIKLTTQKREEIIHKLLELDKHEYQKIGYHPKFGRLSLMNWIDFFLLHESHHIYAIFRIIYSNNNQQTSK